MTLQIESHCNDAKFPHDSCVKREDYIFYAFLVTNFISPHLIGIICATPIMSDSKQLIDLKSSNKIKRSFWKERITAEHCQPSGQIIQKDSIINGIESY